MTVLQAAAGLVLSSLSLYLAWRIYATSSGQSPKRLPNLKKRGDQSDSP